MSGRLTPAAKTLTRISPRPGTGTARVSGNSTSGPPGLLMPMTVICAGSFSMICTWPNAKNLNRHLISQPRSGWQPFHGIVEHGGEPMAIEDDDKPRKKVTHEIGQDLSLLSVEELTERIALMTSEIERLQAAMNKKRASKDAADSFFKA